MYGCSPEFRHSLFVKVFDSVADADKKALETQKDSLAISDSSAVQTVGKTAFINNYSMHPPYQARECENCHSTNDKTVLNEPLPDLCYTCHSPFSKKYAFLHGPVDGGYCTKCHGPHMTKEKKLLLFKGQALCLQCHRIEDVLNNDVHDDLGETDCTECHNPHGGEDRFILN